MPGRNLYHMAKFKTFPLGTFFTFAVAGILVFGGLFIAIVTHSLQAIVAGGLLAAAASYIGWRYWQGKKEVAKGFLGYIQKWDCNVFSTDPLVLKRWTPTMLDELSKVFDNVVLVMGAAHLDVLKGFNLTLVGNHFDFRGTEVSGINHAGTITIWWNEKDAVPVSILSHELSHEILFSEGLTSEREHHDEMTRRGLPW